MKKLQKFQGTVIGITIGLSVSIVTGALLSGILAWTVIKEYNEANAYLIFAIQLLSSGAGAWTAVSLAGEKQKIVCAAETVIYLLFLAGITLLIFHGHCGGVIKGIVAAVSGAILPFFLYRKGKKGGRRRMKSRVYR